MQLNWGFAYFPSASDIDKPDYEERHRRTVEKWIQFLKMSSRILVLQAIKLTATWAPWCINKQLVSQWGVLQEWTLALQYWIWVLVLLTCVWFCLSRVNECAPLPLSMTWEHLHQAQLPFTGKGWHYPDWFSQQPEMGGKWPFSFCVWGDWALKRPLPARCQVSQKVHLSLCLFIHRVVETVKVS